MSIICRTTSPGSIDEPRTAMPGSPEKMTPRTPRPVPSGVGSVCLGIAAALGCMLAAVSRADALRPAGASLQEIVITAEKRKTTVQDTPISITAVRGQDLQDRGLADLSALAAETPGISMKQNGPGQTEFEMRGMTSSGGNSPTVGFYLDDVPMTAPAAAQNGKVVIDPALYDLDRVEVLRGPQGTLYGSGSMGGTIRLITNKPVFDKYHASGEAVLSGTDGGGFNQRLNAMVNVPLVRDQLALRVVASEAHTSGWIDRIVSNDFPLSDPTGLIRGPVESAPVSHDYRGSNASRLDGVHVSLRWRPTADLTLTPAYFYQRIRQDGPSAYDSVPGTPAHYQPFDIAEPYSDEINLGSLNVTYHLRAFDVTSVTGRWQRRSVQVQDASEAFENPFTCITVPGNCSQLPFYGPNGVGSGPVSGTEIDPSKQFSEELRAASNGAGPLQWVGGVFYSDFNSHWQLNTQSVNNLSFVDFSNFTTPAATTTVWSLDEPTTIRQWAVFGQGTYALTRRLKATAGARWFKYRTDLDIQFSGWGSPLGGATPSTIAVSQSENGVDPMFDLSYEISRDLMVYATAAKGFRPGGGNQPLPNFPPPNAPANFHYTAWPDSYRSDSLWSYEVGEKARIFDRLIVNGAVYYEKWSNIQLEELPFGYPLFDNAGNARTWGSELELHAILGDGFKFNLSGAYTHARLNPGPHYTIVLQGQPVGAPASTVLADVPKFTGDVNLSWTAALTGTYMFTARIDNVFTDSRYDLVAINQGQLWRLPSYDLTNLRFGIESDAGWGVTVFADNVSNKHAAVENMTALNLANPDFNRIISNQPLTVGVDLTMEY